MCVSSCVGVCSFLLIELLILLMFFCIVFVAGSGIPVLFVTAFKRGVEALLERRLLVESIQRSPGAWMVDVLLSHSPSSHSGMCSKILFYLSII